MSFVISLVCCAVFVIVLKKLKRLTRENIEPVFMVLMLLGIVALCQPVSFFLYRYGLTILLTGVVGFNIAIHLKQTE